MEGRGLTPKRPYADFVAQAQPALLKDISQFVQAKTGGQLPVGFAVEDFVQLALTQLVPRYDSRDNEAAAYTYARNIAINALLDAIRASKRRRAPEWLAGVLFAAETPEEVAAAAIRRHRIERALAQLPETQRQAVRLHHMEGVTRTETAQIMGMSEAAVKSLLQRGRDSIRRYLETMPALVAIRRLRRPTWLSFTTSQRAVGLACLALVQYPSMVRVPDVAPYAVTVSSDDRSARPVARPVRPVGPALPSFDRTAPRIHSAVVSGSGRQILRKRPVPRRPKAGGCIGSACVGQPYAGDRVCVETGQEEVPACANQDVIGTCPTLNRLALPRITCTRYSDPTIDP